MENPNGKSDGDKFNDPPCLTTPPFVRTVTVTLGVVGHGGGERVQSQSKHQSHHIISYPIVSLNPQVKKKPDPGSDSVLLCARPQG